MKNCKEELINSKLINSIGMYFPDLTDAEILTAGEDTVEGWDSLKVLLILLDLESVLNITIDSSELFKLKCFDDFWNVVKDAPIRTKR